jgi:hypothetical protein
MIVTSIAGLIGALLYQLLVFLVGKILSKPTELRLFLGLNSSDEDSNSFSVITDLVEFIGRIVMIIAIVGAITSIITTSYILFRQ